MDFRGGDAGMSAPVASALKNIANGNTPGQQNRMLRNKAMLAAAGAFLTGAAGSASASHSRNEEAKRMAIQNAKAHPYWKTSREEIAPMEGPAPVTVGGDSGDLLNAANSKFSGVHTATPEDVNGLNDAVKRSQAFMETNAAAHDAPIAGEWTADGHDSMTKDANANAADINTSKNIMRQQAFGGLGNSLRVR